MASIKEVSERAGVSVSTVSNVINGTKYVSSALQERVQHAIEELNYEVDPVARSMKTGKTNQIGVITADISGLFYPYVIKGICDKATASDYIVSVSDIGSIRDPKQVFAREMKCFKSLIQNRVDGIIFASSISEEDTERFFSELKKLAKGYKPVALVSIERDLSHCGIDSVFYDNVEGAKKAVLHLVDEGCQNIVHIAGPEGARVVQDRIKGYLDTLEQIGEKEQDRIVHADYTHQGGYLAMKKLLELKPDLDGVFVANDQMAVGAIKLLQQYGKNVPEDVKVIGFDDVFVAGIVNPPLSTIRVRKKRMGMRGAEMLIERLLNKHTDEEVLREELDTFLIRRQSTQSCIEEDCELSEW